MMGKIERVLFEVRPYIEYYDKLEEKVKELALRAECEEDFLKLLEEEIEKAKEPFKTDLRIFLQKFTFSP